MKISRSVICQFRFLCTERWDGLTPVHGTTEKRFCGVCQSYVYKTSTYQELESNIAAKRCVAIFLEDQMGSSMELMGDVHSTNNVESNTYLLKPVDELARLFDEPHLNLASGITDTLKASNITLIGDLVTCTQERLSEIFASQPASINEIKEVIASLGLMIEISIEGWDRKSAAYR